MSDADRRHLRAQLEYWSRAATRLDNLDDIASPNGWLRLERQAGVLIRATLHRAVRNLQEEVSRARETIEHQDPRSGLRALHKLRRRYRSTEITLDFFADAVNSRSTPRMSAILGAADGIARTSMEKILDPLGISVPKCLVYADKGIGASILKAGMRLWHSENPLSVCAIKLVFSNLFGPSLVHETGHQTAYLTGWNDELREVLQSEIGGDDGRVFSNWSSEINADAIATMLTGYGAAAGLRNVLDAGPRVVWLWLPDDPHPQSWLRLFLSIYHLETCYGKKGPWTELKDVWHRQYPLESAPEDIRPMLARLYEHLPTVSEIVLKRPFNAFGGKSLIEIANPQRVSPEALDEFEAYGGPRLYESPAVIRRDPLRLMALSAYRVATEPESAPERMRRHERAMVSFGTSEIAA